MARILLFSGILLVILIGIGLLHWTYLYFTDQGLVVLDLVISYLVNYLLAVGIYAGMFYLALRENKNLGFIFLWGSALKFAVYFLVLQPLYSADGRITRIEFFYFFVPYICCLITETVWVAKLLRSMEDNSDSTSQ